MPSGVVSVGVLADFASLIEQTDQAGLSMDAFAGRVVTSARTASRAMADYAKAQGASADEAKAAAAQTAAAWDATYGTMSRSAKDAGNAALTTSRMFKQSADEQTAAFQRAAAVQADFEAKQKEATAATKAMADAQEAAAAKVDLLSGKLSGLGEKSAGVAKEISKIGGIGFAASIAGMGDLAAKYQQATQQIAANSDISSKAAANIGKAFLGTSGTSIYSAKDLTEAFAAVSGQLKATEGQALNSAQALKVMSAAGDLAEATSESLSDATAAVSSVMQSYRLSTRQAASAADVLFNTSRALNTPLDAVSQSLTKLHGRLGDLAPSLGDVGGLMQELGSHGVQGSRGVSVVNTAFETLVGGSEPVQKMLQALGVNIFNSQGKFIGLQNTIAELQPKMQQLDQQQQDLAAKTLFGSSAAQVMLSIIQRGPQAFAQATSAAQKLGTAHKAAEEQSRTLAKQLDILKASVEDNATSIGMGLIPALAKMGMGLEDGIMWLDKNKTAADALGIAVGTVLGTAVTVFAAQKAKAFVSGVEDMTKGAVNLTGKVLGFGPVFGTAETETATLTGAVERLSAQFDVLTTSATEAGAAVATAGADAETAAPELAAASSGIGVGGVAAAGGIGLAAGGAALGIGHFLTPELEKLFGGGLKGIGASVPSYTSAQFNLPGDAGNVNQIKTLQDQLNGVTKPTQLSMSQWKDYSAEVTKIQHNLPDMTASQREGFDKLQTAIKDTITALEKYKDAQKSSGGVNISASAMNAGNTHSATWAESLLSSMHAPESKANINSLVAWIQREGNPANIDKFNPLDTTMSGYGGTPTNSVGVQSYPSWGAGIQATSATLASYPAITQALMAGKGLGVGGATAQELLKWSGGGYSGIGSAGTGAVTSAPSSSSSAGLNSALGAAVMNIGSGGQLPAAIQATSYASQATALQDQTTKAQAVGQAQVTVLQAINQQLQDKGAAIVQKLSDRQAKADDQSAKTVTALKDAAQTASDKATAQVTAMKDQQTILDQTSAIQVQAIKNQTQVIQDTSAIQVAAITGAATRIADADNAQATLITDNAQTNADTISERGLYGLNLVAQKLQVTADQIKAGFDAQIATAQANLDADQMAANVANAQAQLATDQVTATQTMKELQSQQNLNMVTLKENALEAKAQAHLDAVTAKEDAREAAAKIHVDSVTMTEDAKANAAKAHLDATTVSQDNRILKATQHADSVQLSVDVTKIGPAQTAVDMNAGASKTVQTEMQNQLNLATAQGNVSINAAQLQLAGVTASANNTIAGAQNAYQKVQNAADTAIQTANNQASSATDAANKAIQLATNQNTVAQNTANRLMQSANNAYNSIQDAANKQIALATETQASTAAAWAAQIAAAQGQLSGIQGNAAIGEAQAQGAVTGEQAFASTQFAGSGLVVNIFGNTADPNEIGSEVSWAIRSNLTT